MAAPNSALTSSEVPAPAALSGSAAIRAVTMDCCDARRAGGPTKAASAESASAATQSERFIDKQREASI